MPHFIAEYSANIKDDIDFKDFFGKVNTFLGSTGVFPLGGIRSRAIRRLKLAQGVTWKRVSRLPKPYLH